MGQIKRIHEMLVNKEISCVDLTKKYLEAIVKDFIEKNILPLDERLEMRGIGLIWGIEFENIPVKGLADKVIERCFENGLIIEGAGRKNSVVKLMPPLVIEEETLLQGLEIIKKSVTEELKRLK